MVILNLSILYIAIDLWLWYNLLTAAASERKKDKRYGRKTILADLWNHKLHKNPDTTGTLRIARPDGRGTQPGIPPWSVYRGDGWRSYALFSFV